ncbi:TetR family transcriptional regulator [Tenacibaculum finnmarkense genomovar ulcerans]|uniref:TetR family transcriptional regulator n=1 Tax=Tenacibaculum finnmarkense TaxID=2781243 RepID=UPI001E6046E4|nr:TetR family transcriptional regulator [Tenacibaculum finnmarkense]MCD8433396.1 TetR family transcriptional regulator [Tenacibaculum finnmarkense genomovar ulcerans]
MGRKNMSTIRKKEMIIGFYELSKKIGLENVSIGKLAEYLQISKSLVMHYFNNKALLLKELNNYILEKYLLIINSEENISIKHKDDLNAFIKNLFTRKWNDYIDDGVFYSLYALIYRDEELRENFNNFNKILHLALHKKLTQAKERHIISNDNIDTLTEIIFAMIDGGYYYLGTQTNDSETYNKQVEIYLNHINTFIIYK